MHDVTEALDLHEFTDLDRARDAHLQQVVAGEIDEHQVFGALLRIGEQLVGEGEILLRTDAPRAGPCDRMHVDAGILHLDESFRRGPHYPVRFAARRDKESRYMYGLGLSVRSTRYTSIASAVIS